MKYPELAKVSFTLPQPPEKPPLPKLVPVPYLPIPNTVAEEAAINEFRDFEAFKMQLHIAKLEELRIEKARKEAFSKILVPQAAASDLSQTIQKRPDISEFDTIISSSNDLNTTNNDFHLLKEIMGGVESVKIAPSQNTNTLPPPKDMKRLGSMQSSLASSPQSFSGAWQRNQAAGGPPSISSSPQSSIISLGSPPKQQSPQRGMETPPPVVRNISPALKQKLYTGRGSNEKFESLVQMGFKASTVTKALDTFSDQQEILDFLVLLQDLNEEYVMNVISINDKNLLDKSLTDFKDLVEMGFDKAIISQILLSTGLDKAQALEKLLSQ